MESRKYRNDCQAPYFAVTTTITITITIAIAIANTAILKSTRKAQTSNTTKDIQKKKIPTMDPNLFKGKTYIVTGGAAGIGLGIVRQLSTYGATVYSLDIVMTPTEDPEIFTRPNVHHLSVDVRDQQACAAAVQQISSTHNGAIDGLVNNAGICPSEGELPDHELYRTVIDTNLGGAFNMGSEVLPIMRQRGKGGAVVNVGSTSCLSGKNRLSLYASSKHALLGLTRSWALDWAKDRIRVNCVGPGKFCVGLLMQSISPPIFFFFTL